jgi:hypothetical protein
MKTNLILILLLFPIVCFSQSSKNLFFGIDLDLDFYSLTNYQQLTYFLADSDTPKEIPYVMTDFEYYHNNIDKRLLSLGFDELLLGFPRGKQTQLNTLKPELFISRIFYTPNNYELKSRSDISKIKSLIIDQYGEAELNMDKEDSSTYKWEGVFYEIILTTRKDDMKTTLLYLKY